MMVRNLSIVFYVVLALPAAAAFVETPFVDKAREWQQLTSDVFTYYPAVSDDTGDIERMVLSWTLLRCGGVSHEVAVSAAALPFAMGSEYSRLTRELIGAFAMTELERWPSADFCRYAKERVDP